MDILLVTLLVLIVIGWCQQIYVLEWERIFLFLDQDRVLYLVLKTLVVVVTKNTVILFKLWGVPHEFHVVSGNFVTSLYSKVVQQGCSFSNYIRKSKIVIKLINKVTLVLEPVMENLLLFLVEFHFELVLCNTGEIGHHKVDLYSIWCELYWVRIKVKMALE